MANNTINTANAINTTTPARWAEVNDLPFSPKGDGRGIYTHCPCCGGNGFVVGWYVGDRTCPACGGSRWWDIRRRAEEVDCSICCRCPVDDSCGVRSYIRYEPDVAPPPPLEEDDMPF